MNKREKCVEFFDKIKQFIQCHSAYFFVFAKKGHDTYGRGCVVLPFFSCSQMENDKKLRAFYIASDKIFSLLNNYNPNSQFVFVIMCPKHDKENGFFVVASTMNRPVTFPDNKVYNDMLHHDFGSNHWSINFVTVKEAEVSPHYGLYNSVIFHKFNDQGLIKIHYHKKETVLQETRHNYNVLIAWIDLCCDYCKKQLDRKQVKRCSSCLVAVYCSKQCQKHDWKQIHKVACGLWNV
jgi:hypothetical protein